MHLKIYFNEKPLYLADRIDQEVEPFIHHDDAIFMDEFSTPGINSMIHEMRSPKVQAGVYIHKDLGQLQKALWKKFTVIKAAGGLILNKEGQLLLMKRRGKWDLPKGKLDPGESLENCAVREVKEETGLKEVRLEKKLITTYHTYEESGKHILKESHWYKMFADAGQTLHPETGEDITQVLWVPHSKIYPYLIQTFPLIRDVIEAGGIKV